MDSWCISLLIICILASFYNITNCKIKISGCLFRKLKSKKLEKLEKYSTKNGLNAHSCLGNSLGQKAEYKVKKRGKYKRKLKHKKKCDVEHSALHENNPSSPKEGNATEQPMETECSSASSSNAATNKPETNAYPDNHDLDLQFLQDLEMLEGF